MTDHQQAAIEAGARALFVMQHRVSANVFDKGDYKALKDAAIRESTNAIAAAEPHLRKKWAEEVLKEGILGAGYSVLMNPNRGEHPVTTFTRAVKHMLDLLEGVGE